MSGLLDERVGGPPQELERPASKKRTIYGRAARSPYSLLTLFDYPDPNITSEQREVTNVPLQGLFFDGRIGEDFKLSSGTWVSVGPLRTQVIAAGAPYVRDVVIAGYDRSYVAALVCAICLS